jgi:hypothetical protein
VLLPDKQGVEIVQALDGAARGAIFFGLYAVILFPGKGLSFFRLPVLRHGRAGAALPAASEKE